jgi:hypothetical protein
MGRDQHLPAGGSGFAGIAWTVSMFLCGTLAGCSFLIDSKAEQCSIDADCTQFGGHPFCKQGVCVESGLGPDGCFFGTPTQQTDYLNACTTSKFVAYDNCGELKLGCPNGTATMPAPSGAVQGTSGASNIPADPTNLCTDNAPMIGANPAMIWLSGSSDFGPELRAVQRALNASPQPYRAVFQNGTSCDGVTAIFSGPTRIKDGTAGKGGWPYYFDVNGNQVNCRVDPAGMPGTTPNANIDIGISNLFAPTCNPAFMPGTASGVRDYNGPIVPFVLAVKGQSGEQAISTEAARLVFGNGGIAPSTSGLNNAMPWTDYKNFYIRNQNAGSTVLTALLIDVPRTMFWGIDRVTTENLRDGLLAAVDTPSSGAIGILSIDFYDKYRGNLKALYLQSKGQKVGFLPDSGPTTTDKINVRDGHYPLWGYAHMFTRLDPNANSPFPAPQAFILNLSVPQIEQTLLDNLIGASLTPGCAMKVERTSEIGDFAAHGGAQCGCYFDFKTTGHTDCTSCGSSEDCPGKHPCRYGYCELNEPAL